jgi:hypothetical protein
VEPQVAPLRSGSHNRYMLSFQPNAREPGFHTLSVDGEQARLDISAVRATGSIQLLQGTERCASSYLKLARLQGSHRIDALVARLRTAIFS